jgi:hypothetical protein
MKVDLVWCTALRNLRTVAQVCAWQFVAFGGFQMHFHAHMRNFLENL